MTNLEKLIQVIGETFPGTEFDESDVRRRLQKCAWIICPIEGECNPTKCQVEDFWEMEYALHDLKPEPDADIVTGFVVMVYDDKTRIPYSGCIYPTYKQTENEVEEAESHGWTTSIKSVKFQMISKGGGKNA